MAGPTAEAERRLRCMANLATQRGLGGSDCGGRTAEWSIDMHKHRHWDMWLHDDAELADLLGSAVLGREVLQQWPGSQVERIDTADGPVVYKCQCVPSVEPDFYDAARSPLLVEAHTVYRGRGCSCMVMEFLEGPSLQQAVPGEPELLRIGHELLERIAAVTGRLPSRLDIRTPEKWRAYSEEVLLRLAGLLQPGTSTGIPDEDRDRLKRWARSDAPLCAIRRRPGYVHNDLALDNVFVTEEGLRVIDWQFPLLGPTELDLAQLLDDGGVDPLGHVPPEVVQLREFLGLGWTVQCQTGWIRPVTSYEPRVTEAAQCASREADGPLP
jgi:hypothetical protein